MSINIVVPKSIFGGWQWEFGHLRINFLYHALQCDRRWIFGIHWWREGHKPVRLGYLTAGERAEDIAGWHWPWNYRFTSGRY